MSEVPRITVQFLRDQGLDAEADALRAAVARHRAWTNRAVNESAVALSYFGSKRVAEMTGQVTP